MSERRRPLLMLAPPTTYHLTTPIAELRANVDEWIEETGEQGVFMIAYGEPLPNDHAYLLLEMLELWGFEYFPHPACDRLEMDGRCRGHPPGSDPPRNGGIVGALSGPVGRPEPGMGVDSGQGQ